MNYLPCSQDRDGWCWAPHNIRPRHQERFLNLFLYLQKMINETIMRYINNVLLRVLNKEMYTEEVSLRLTFKKVESSFHT